MTGKETTENLSKIKLIFEYHKLTQKKTEISHFVKTYPPDKMKILIDTLDLRIKQIEEILGI